VTPTLRDIILLCLISLLAYLPGLASLPVIDRDEARYAQATVQMVETGDYIDIRFQEDARYKKPVGAYWAQVAGLTVTGQLDNVRAGERPIWAQRLPSVVGALIAVIATYLTGLVLFGRREAFWGALLLAVSVSMVFEAHIAKTDAMLAGASAVVLYGFAAHKAWPFWLGIAVGILLKGPVILGVVGLALLSLRILPLNDSNLSRARTSLLAPLPILASLALILPWFIAIYFVSDGTFYAEALGKDFGSKIGSAQETHGGWPGYYALTTLVMFWPGVIVLPLVILWSWRNRALPAVALLLCWIVPMWVVLELVPTKLPHYTLPLYPALALLCGAALVRFTDARISRWIGAVLFAITGLTLAFAIGYMGPGQISLFALGPLAAALVIGGLYIWLKQSDAGLSMIAGVIIAALFFGWAAPRGGMFDVTPQIMDYAESDMVVSPDYREPSLVYRAGTLTKLSLDAPLKTGDDLVLKVQDDRPPVCAERRGRMSGFQYTKGRPFGASIYATHDCAPAELETWRAREAARRADNK